MIFALGDRSENTAPDLVITSASSCVVVCACEPGTLCKGGLRIGAGSKAHPQVNSSSRKQRELIQFRTILHPHSHGGIRGH